MSAQDISASLAQQRFSAVNTRLHNAVAHSQREPGSVKLLAVSKMQTPQQVAELYDLGQRAFGENYLQQALEKQQALPSLDIEWHFIGPIQSNKTRDIAHHFAWVHSVDREKVAKRLSDQRPSNLPPLQVCIQVNVSGEESKSGVTPETLPALAASVAELPGLQLRGLMALPAPTSDVSAQHLSFKKLRELMAQLNEQLSTLKLDTLSMGMSGDMEAAIDEGTTMVRVGTALFGPRPPIA
ncbi:YggS family pyridoxal phosphate-dependent enzyme [Carnimonas nigrificans]|uniref:YggS family pyridoxal phosphate-dependent enzyme n=1 Tax=Carnimonas nigrificans TaxID=64323 RepID=UPI00046E9FB2|nr:YggS family pyridoxal phosphate-dependent enzyme [Carnimonas nigrificans]